MLLLLPVLLLLPPELLCPFGKAIVSEAVATLPPAELRGDCSRDKPKSTVGAEVWEVPGLDHERCVGLSPATTTAHPPVLEESGLPCSSTSSSLPIFGVLPLRDRHWFTRGGHSALRRGDGVRHARMLLLRVHRRPHGGNGKMRFVNVCLVRVGGRTCVWCMIPVDQF